MAAERIKSSFLQDTWLPLAINAGSLFYPRRKRSKRMKVFTLTSPSNYIEIESFKAEKLTSNENVFAWTDSIQKRARLEVEIPIRVLGATRFEDNITSGSSSILTYFPFDILNIDFSSQTSHPHPGRLETEINALEHTIKSQKERIQDKKGFVLFYTTKLDAEVIVCSRIKSDCDAVHVNGWIELDIRDYPENSTEYHDKLRIIQTLFQHFIRKYDFTLSGDLRSVCEPLEGEHLCSFAGLYKVG